MSHTFLKLGLLVVALSATAGCSDFELGESTKGEKGEVEFSYAGYGCFFGCAVDTPLAVGSSTPIHVTDGGNGAGVVPVSTNPDVLSFQVERRCSCSSFDENSGAGYPISEDESCPEDFELSCSNVITAHAVAEGSAKLELRRPDGTVLDRIEIAARAPEGVRFEVGRDVDDEVVYASASEVVLASGEHVAVRATFLDSQGAALRTADDITWSIEGDAARLGVGWFAQTHAQGDPLQDVSAFAPGNASVSVAVGDFDGTIPVRVD